MRQGEAAMCTNGVCMRGKVRAAKPSAEYVFVHAPLFRRTSAKHCSAMFLNAG